MKKQVRTDQDDSQHASPAPASAHLSRQDLRKIVSLFKRGSHNFYTTPTYLAWKHKPPNQISPGLWSWMESQKRTATHTESFRMISRRHPFVGAFAPYQARLLLERMEA